MKHLGTRRIETKRLILRRFTLDDALPMYRNWASDHEATKYLTWQTHENAEQTKSVLESWISSYENEDKYIWCIAKKENDEPIGSINAFHYQEKINAMEVGYCISRSYWHQGITSEALGAVMKYLLDEVGIDRNAFHYQEKINAMEVGYCISRSYWHQGITSEALGAVMKYLLDEVGIDRIEARHDAINPNSGGVMRKCGMRHEGTRIRAGWTNAGIYDTELYGYVRGVTDADRRNAPDALLKRHDADRQGVQTPQRPPHSCICDEEIERVAGLAKLFLSDEEKELARHDMGNMLNDMKKLGELNTTDVEPMSHVFPISNVFREDVVTSTDGGGETLLNAPEQRNGGFLVPKTIS